MGSWDLQSGALGEDPRSSRTLDNEQEPVNDRSVKRNETLKMYVTGRQSRRRQSLTDWGFRFLQRDSFYFLHPSDPFCENPAHGLEVIHSGNRFIL